MSYLSVTDVTVTYGDKPVVEGLTISLNKGDVGCLLGFSGCGKTTALRAIAGLELIHQGNICLAERTLSTATVTLPPAKRGIGMVFQDYALFSHLTVAQNIGFGLHDWSKTNKKNRIADMLDLIALTEQAHKRPDQLSGGQQQRVALARALAPNPKLLLLDEPFSNLDVLLREQLARQVRDMLKQTQTTAILVTHDQHEAFAIADQIGVMQNGHIAQWGTPSTLYHQPNSKAVANFVGEGVFIDGSIHNGHVSTALGDIYRRVGINDNQCPIWQEGQHVQVLVRPDDIVHYDASLMQATVTETVFRGANYLHTLQLTNGEHVLSLIPSHHDHPIGSQIGIRPILEHVVIFPA